MTNIIPQGYFSELTTIHLRPRFASTSRWLLRSVEAMLACKLTLVYGRYYMMMDLRSLVVSDYHDSYEHAEVMADFMNCLLPFQHTTPSDLMQSRESYADQSIDMYKEYKHYLELFEIEGFPRGTSIHNPCKRSSPMGAKTSNNFLISISNA